MRLTRRSLVVVSALVALMMAPVRAALPAQDGVGHHGHAMSHHAATIDTAHAAGDSLCHEGQPVTAASPVDTEHRDHAAKGTCCTVSCAALSVPVSLPSVAGTRLRMVVLPVNFADGPSWASAPPLRPPRV